MSHGPLKLKALVCSQAGFTGFWVLEAVAPKTNHRFFLAKNYQLFTTYFGEDRYYKPLVSGSHLQTFGYCKLKTVYIKDSLF